MTNDEAIRILENAPWFKWAGQATVISKEVERVREAEQMAIDALKAQLPKEDATSDCISRQEAIRIASGYCHFTNIPKELAKLPSVQPEPSDAVYRLYKRAYEAGQRNARPEKAQLSGEDSTFDCISRRDAVDALMEILDRPNHAEFLYTDEICKVLNELPSVHPEPCDDAVSRKAVEEMLRNGSPARGMWEIEGDIVKQTVCETLADALMDLEKLPSVQPEYEPVKTEDFAKTMSENSLYSFMAWHGEALELMEREGFVICKKTS